MDEFTILLLVSPSATQTSSSTINSLSLLSSSPSYQLLVRPDFQPFLKYKEAPEVGGCTTGTGETGDTWDTGLTGSTVLRLEIKSKMGEIRQS